MLRSLAPTTGSGAGAAPKISGSGSGSRLGAGAAQSWSPEPAPQPLQSLVKIAPVLVSIEHYKRNRQFYESIIKYHLQPLLQDPEDLHIFVASAHVLHNEFRPNTYTVRLNAMARDLSVHLARHHSEVNGMYCKSDNGEVAQFRLYLMDAPPACAWKNYFIDCEFLSPVEAVEIVSVDSSGTGFP
uniref:Uncharacterized protein n=1 Tax=Bursaphelenchus xylophilus TaxID=6326 RepID=A0A1I7SH58_BURXY